jgi:hypothetical protein
MVGPTDRSDVTSRGYFAVFPENSGPDRPGHEALDRVAFRSLTPKLMTCQ